MSAGTAFSMNGLPVYSSKTTSAFFVPRAAGLAVGSMLTNFTSAGLTPISFAKAGPHDLVPVRGGNSDRLAYQVLGLGDARVLPEEHGVGMLVENDPDDLDLRALGPAFDRHGRVGDADLSLAGIDHLDGESRALADHDVDVESLLLEPPFLHGHVVGGVVAGDLPVELEVDLRRCLGESPTRRQSRCEKYGRYLQSVHMHFSFSKRKPRVRHADTSISGHFTSTLRCAQGMKNLSARPTSPNSETPNSETSMSPA